MVNQKLRMYFCLNPVIFDCLLYYLDFFEEIRDLWTMHAILV